MLEHRTPNDMCCPSSSGNRGLRVQSRSRINHLQQKSPESRRLVLRLEPNVVVICTIAKHGKKKVNAAMSLGLASFVILLGFVSSAFLHAADGFIRGRPIELVIQTDSMTHIAKLFVYCMFLGPYIVAERSLVYWIEDRIGFSHFAIGAVLAVLWSFCAGIFVAQLLVGLGLLSA